MKKLMFVVALLPALACGNSPYSEIPTPSDGGSPSDSADSGGPPRETAVCGNPGQFQRAGFSYIDCSTSGNIDGRPFGFPILVGTSVPIFVDSPFASISSVSSSDPSVALFTLDDLASPRTVQAVGIAPGKTRLILHASDMSIIDQVSVSVDRITGMFLDGAPSEPTTPLAFNPGTAVLEGTTMTICAEALGPDGIVIGDNLIDATSSGGVAVSRQACPCVFCTGSSVTHPEGFAVTTSPDSVGDLTLTAGAVESKFQLWSVKAAEITDVLLEQTERSSDNVPFSELRVTIMAGNRRVIGAACEMTTSPGLRLTDGLGFGAPLIPVADVHAYLLFASNKTASTFDVTCSLDGGRITRTFQVSLP
jgi:hypothetical protein